MTDPLTVNGSILAKRERRIIMMRLKQTQYYKRVDFFYVKIWRENGSLLCTVYKTCYSTFVFKDPRQKPFREIYPSEPTTCGIRESTRDKKKGGCRTLDRSPPIRIPFSINDS